MKKQKHSKEAELTQKLARALADYDNLKKRVDRDLGDLARLSARNIIVRLLPILDMLEMSQKHLEDQGLAIAISNFKEALHEEGAEEMKLAKGDKFDESKAEVVEIEETGNDEKSGTVSEVLQDGWEFGDNFVIRHAKVKVYKK